MARKGPGGLGIAAERCSSCIFGPNSAIKGDEEVYARLRAQWRARDTHQICHQFQVGNHYLTDQGEVVCRGFYETQPPSQMMRIAERLGLLRFVPLPQQEPRRRRT